MRRKRDCLNDGGYVDKKRPLIHFISLILGATSCLKKMEKKSELSGQFGLVDGNIFEGIKEPELEVFGPFQLIETEKNVEKIYKGRLFAFGKMNNLSIKYRAISEKSSCVFGSLQVEFLDSSIREFGTTKRFDILKGCPKRSVDPFSFGDDTFDAVIERTKIILKMSSLMSIKTPRLKQANVTFRDTSSTKANSLDSGPSTTTLIQQDSSEWAAAQGGTLLTNEETNTTNLEKIKQDNFARLFLFNALIGNFSGGPEMTLPVADFVTLQRNYAGCSVFNLNQSQGEVQLFLSRFDQSLFWKGEPFSYDKYKQLFGGSPLENKSSHAQFGNSISTRFYNGFSEEISKQIARQFVEKSHDFMAIVENSTLSATSKLEMSNYLRAVLEEIVENKHQK